MKVLFLAPRLPFPADTGGKIRTYNLLAQAARTHQVALVCFSFDREDGIQAAELKRRLHAEIHLVPHEEPRQFQRLRQALVEPLPVSVVKYSARSMQAKLRTLTAAKAFDLAHIDHIHMAQYQDVLQDIPVYIDDHNVEYMILERCARVENFWPKSLAYKMQAEKMRDHERDMLTQCRACGAVSEDDARILRELTGRKHGVHVVENGVDVDYFDSQGHKDAESQETGALVFTGSMDWLPNEDAVMFFIKDILPLIWESKPDVKFYVVGKGPSAALLNAARKDARIQVTGRVEDVRPYIARSQVFVCPLRIGGGTRLKILEALAMHKAVVSTTIGAEGIAYCDREHLLAADEPQDFARQVVALLDQPQRRAALGRQGRDLVQQKYDWRSIGRKLEGIYHEMAHRKI